MSTDYRLYILDEFDWGYAHTTVDKQVELCRTCKYVDSVVHPAYGLILVDYRGVGDNLPRELAASGVLWDMAYVQVLPTGALMRFFDTRDLKTMTWSWRYAYVTKPKRRASGSKGTRHYNAENTDYAAARRLAGRMSFSLRKH